MQSCISTCSCAGLHESLSAGDCKHSCGKVSMVLLCRTVGFGEPEGRLISRSQAKLYFALPCLWFLFLALVHGMKHEVKT